MKHSTTEILHNRHCEDANTRDHDLQVHMALREGLGETSGCAIDDSKTHEGSLKLVFGDSGHLDTLLLY